MTVVKMLYIRSRIQPPTIISIPQYITQYIISISPPLVEVTNNLASTYLSVFKLASNSASVSNRSDATIAPYDLHNV